MVIDESYCFAQQESNSQSVAEKIFAFGGEVLSAAKRRCLFKLLSS
jgi:hypothetical protein